MTPEQIAKGLTKAQKKALLGAKWSEYQTAYRPAGYYLTADKRVRYNLAWLRLISDYLGQSQRLTELGLSVRAILEAQNDRPDI